MKVKIGKYINYFGAYQLFELIFFWTENYPADEKLYDRWDYKLRDKLAEKLASTKFSDLCEWIHNKRHRKIKIHIDNYDVWNMDYTLALIILPMLIKLKEIKHGHPLIDDADVPDNLNIRSTDCTESDEDFGWDCNASKRWDWVLDEMIFAFDAIVDDSWEDQFYYKHDGGSFDRENYNKYQNRISNGLRLFGVYYRGLWD